MALTSFNVWQRYDWSYTLGTVRNLSSVEAIVRVSDASTGEITGAWPIAPKGSARVVDGRPGRWLVDLTPEEEALGRRNAFSVELLAGGTCSLSAAGYLDDDSPTIDVVVDGLAYTDYPLKASAGVDGSRALADPCLGSSPPARGIIANLTSRPAVVGEGFVIAACSTRIAHPGDMAIPATTATAVRFRVPSIEAQDERWPLEPRTVTLRRDGVFDDESFGWGFDEGELAACWAASPR